MFNVKAVGNPVFDDHAVAFSEEGDFFDYVEEREANAEWIDPCPIKEVKFVPMENMPILAVLESAKLGVSPEAYVDTLNNAKLIVETPDGRKMLMRVNAMNQAKQRLMIDGTVFNRFTSEQTAMVLNECCSVNSNKVVMRYADEKASAFLSAASYAIIPAVEVFDKAKESVREVLQQPSFLAGFYAHAFSAAEWKISGTARKTRKIVERYQDLLGGEYDVVCSVKTSDTGNCAVTVEPKLVKSGAATWATIPLGEAMRAEHKGSSDVEQISEMFKMFTSALEKGAERLEAWEEIKLFHSANALLSAMKRVQLPKKYAMDVLERFVAIHGRNNASALDLFMAAQEVPALVEAAEHDLLKTYRMEDTIARLLGMNWRDLDVAGDLVW